MFTDVSTMTLYLISSVTELMSQLLSRHLSSSSLPSRKMTATLQSALKQSSLGWSSHISSSTPSKDWYSPSSRFQAGKLHLRYGLSAVSSSFLGCWHWTYGATSWLNRWIMSPNVSTLVTHRASRCSTLSQRTALSSFTWSSSSQSRRLWRDITSRLDVSQINATAE